MDLKKKDKDRKNASAILNWLLANADFQHLEENNYMDTYYSAAKWFEQNLGNAAYVLMEPDDVGVLYELRKQPLNTMELCDRLEMDRRKLNAHTNKLLLKGYIISYKEENNRQLQNRLTYYRITPYGIKYLIENNA